MGISCWVAHKAVWTPEKVAVRFEGRDITYREFEDRVAHLTGFMAERLELGEGDRVAFLGGNSPEILDLMHRGDSPHNCSFLRYLVAATTQDLLEEDVARSAAPNPQDFDRAMKGIY